MHRAPRWTLALTTLALTLLSSSAARAETITIRTGGPYGSVLIGGGVTDQGVLPDTLIGTSGSGTLGMIDAMARFGWKTPLGVSPLLEGRAGLIFGAVGAGAQKTWGLLGGAQWTWKPLKQFQPYVNARVGIRDDPSARHATAAFGLGIEAVLGYPWTIGEITVEPIGGPWQLTFHIGIGF
jgi:hypothetical protein